MSSAAPALTEDTRLYRISEMSRLTQLKPFVLRYWEEEFPMLEPVKTRRGHRLYGQEHVDLVLKIKRLLYDEGYTIAGARRYLRDLDPNAAAASLPHGEDRAAFSAEMHSTQLSRKMLLDLRDSLRSFLTLLEGK
jgi:DNA-binding transcriptional MerR regulator